MTRADVRELRTAAAADGGVEVSLRARLELENVDVFEGTVRLEVGEGRLDVERSDGGRVLMSSPIDLPPGPSVAPDWRPASPPNIRHSPLQPLYEDWPTPFSSAAFPSPYGQRLVPPIASDTTIEWGTDRSALPSRRRPLCGPPPAARRPRYPPAPAPETLMGICCSRSVEARPEIGPALRLEPSPSLAVVEAEKLDSFTQEPRSSLTEEGRESKSTSMDRTPSSSASLSSIVEEPSASTMIASILQGRTFRNDDHRRSYIQYLQKGDPGSTPVVGRG